MAWYAPQRVKMKDGCRATLRPAREEEAGELLTLVNEVAAEGIYIGTEKLLLGLDEERQFIRDALENPRKLLIVAEAGGKIVAISSIFAGSFGLKDRHVGTLGMLVAKPYRELGLGTTMMTYLLAWARAVGLEKVDLEVFSTNQRAINLYRKFGFIEEGRRRRAFRLLDRYADDVMMGLFLATPKGG
ncbi:MAG: GNAT family N-acetyltransferase [Chloroflexi bacterium]|nr:GNAT family N-acetyltransferase [Chloroflexota bacterium]